MKKFNLTAIQKNLSIAGLDGWLFYDFMGSDPIGRSILNLSLQMKTSRRWFYLIPAQGAPFKLVHVLENKILDQLPGKKEVYTGWKEMTAKLQQNLHSKQKIAVQYAPLNAIPMISKIDAGTFELLRSFNLNLLTSADLVQQFEGCLSKAQINTHLNVASELTKIVDKLFNYIKKRLQNHQEVTEFSGQTFLQHQLNSLGLISDLTQLIAVADHTGDPRYFPTKNSNTPIRNKSLIQISLRAKEKDENAVYASTSWVAYVGDDIPEKYVNNFQILKKVRDGVISFMHSALKNGHEVCGWQVDEEARKIIEQHGMGPYYLHRTGHSLGTDFYGHAVNLDNLETRDTRLIIPDLCFTVLPGIYFSDYGMRSEINLYVDKKGVHLSTKMVQDDIYQIKIN
jgi:Xaa-Pro dipeptidase